MPLIYVIYVYKIISIYSIHFFDYVLLVYICQCWRKYLGLMVGVMTPLCINSECLRVIIDMISLWHP